MKKYTFAGHSIYSTNEIDKEINIDQILQKFQQNSEKYNYTHYINNRWENIYLNPKDIPAVLPLLSFAISTALELFQDMLKPHQSLVIPHELLGYEKNEFWFNAATNGESTGMHNHNANAIISGVIYLQIPENSANLFFKSGKNNELEIEVETGKVIFFPSELDHYVPENKSNEMRISLSFNLYKFPISASIMHELPV